MQPTLCETFRLLAFRTFDQMGRARRVGHQPLEETFTDTNILELKDRHPGEIFSKTFTKSDEGVNGADWEWWLTDASKSKWLGLRVQAKVLHFDSNAFTHLHYKSGKSRTYQLTKLKRECARNGLIPLYCFYLHGQPTSFHSGFRCATFGYTAEAFGCSLASLSYIESLQKSRNANDLNSILRGAYPWHCLVCCSGYGGLTLPERAWKFIVSGMQATIPQRRRRSSNDVELQPVGVRNQPPHYVYAVANGRRPDTVPSTIRGIVVVKDAES